MGFVVAVTGGVASGKSAVTRRFEALGVTVHDADLIARELVEPGQPALAEIAARFGAGVISADGSLDRRAMRERVFATAEDRRALEGILHPRVREVLRERALLDGSGKSGPHPGLPPRGGEGDKPGVGSRREVGPHPGLPPRAGEGDKLAAGGGDRRQAEGGGQRAPYVVLAIPLLAESEGDYSWVHRVLVVDVPRAVQHARLVARDGVDAAAADAMIDAQATREARLAIADDVVVNDGPIEALDRAVRTLDARYRALAAAGVAA